MLSSYVFVALVAFTSICWASSLPDLVPRANIVGDNREEGDQEEGNGFSDHE